MQTFAALNQILMMVLLGALGLGLRRGKVLDDGMIAGLSRLLLLVAQPALMIVSTQRAHDAGAVGNYLTVMALSTLTIVACLTSVYALTGRMARGARAVAASASALSNVGYVGLPIVQGTFGEEGVFYLSAYIIGLNLAQWTVGEALFTGVNLKSLKNLLNPIFVAAIIGTLLFVGNVALPQVALNAFGHLSNLNTPLAMLVLGARLETLRARQLADGRMWAAVAVKLLAMPIALLLALKWTAMPPLLVGVLVLGAAMPSGVNIQLQAERYGADTALSARCISVSSLLCAATIPLIVWLVSL